MTGGKLLFLIRNYVFNPWLIVSAIIAFILTFPVLVVVTGLFNKSGPVREHLITYLLQDYVLNTLVLLAGVGLLTIIAGVASAWLIAGYSFPGSRFFDWALILPLAIPTYIVAYCYHGFFGYTGLLQKLYGWFAGKEIASRLFFDILHIEYLIIILSLVLYPYVYLITRVSFRRQSAGVLEAASLSGQSRLSIFFKISLPLARPAIVGGVSLALMEVLNDYGAVKYFGVNTFTSGIFRAWFSLGDADTALWLSSVLLVLVFLLLWFEKWQRGKASFSNTGNRLPPLKLKPLKGVQGWLASLFCFILFTGGFLLPVIQLLYWASLTLDTIGNSDFMEMVLNSFMVAGITAVLCVFFALLLIFTLRLYNGLYMQTVVRMATLGYSIPGAVIAIGVLLPLIFLDRTFSSYFSFSAGTIVTTTLTGLFLAYLTRFIIVSYNALDAEFARISKNTEEASRSLGRSTLYTLIFVDLPLVKGALLSGLLLVFIEALKELPLVLILRPFNFNTLATKTFELAGNEMFAASSGFALLIILTGIFPVIMLNRMSVQK